MFVGIKVQIRKKQPPTSTFERALNLLSFVTSLTNSFFDFPLKKWPKLRAAFKMVFICKKDN